MKIMVDIASLLFFHMSKLLLFLAICTIVASIDCSGMVGCTDCSSTTTCTVCNSTLNRVLSGTSCVCNTGYTVSGGVCVSCPSQIIGCSVCSSTSVCTTCNAGLFMVSSGNVCACMTGYILSGSTCVACSTMLGCTTCSSTTTCTQCDSVQLMTLSGSSCACQTGYVLNSNVCSNCTTYMPGCTACSSTSVCTTCNASLNMVKSGSSCVCATGYTAFSGACTLCSVFIFGCTACTSSSVCTTCDSSINTVLNGAICSCASGYAMSSSTCATCSSMITGCNICSSASTCTSCVSGRTVQSGMCPLCSVLINGCLVCSSPSVCTNCDTSAFMELNSSICTCISGYTLNPNVCVTCASFMPNCSLCNSSTNCTTCQSGYFINSILSCSICSSTIPGCLVCSSGSVCTQCDTANHYQLSGNTCVCQAGYFYNSSTITCDSCPNAIVDCVECSSKTMCTLCATPLGFSDGRCKCPHSNQYYSQPLSQCIDCDSTCMTCNSSGCLSCNSTQYRVLSVLACVCKLNYHQDLSGNCISNPTCLNGFTYTGVYCKEICGDGILFDYDCDDGNLIDGDGCSSTCTIETNFSCKDGSSTTPSKCSYNQPLKLQLIGTTKDIYDNAVNFTISVSPQLKVLESLNFSKIVNSSLPTSSILANYSAGILKVRVVYTRSIQLDAATLSISPPTSFDNTYDMQVSSTSFVVDPSNTEAYYYPSATYQTSTVVAVIFKASTGLALAILIIGVGFWKMVGVESIHVLQILFFGMSMLTTLQPGLSPITELGSVINGYNRLFSDFKGAFNFDDPTMSKVFTQMNIGARFLENCNYMIFAELGIIVIGGLLFLLSRAYDTAQQGLLMVSKFILNEVLLVMILFNSMNIGFSLGVHALYWDSPAQQSSVSQIVNIAPLIAVLLIHSVNSFFIVRRGDLFWHNGKMFKRDSLCKSHPIILWVVRFLMGAIMGGTNKLSYGIYGVLGIQAVYLCYMSVKRPYKKTAVSIRAIANQSVNCFILAMAVVYNFYVTNKMIAEDEWGTIMNIPVWVVATAVGLTVLMNFVYMFYAVYKAICKSRSSEVHPKSDVDPEEIDQSNNHLINKSPEEIRVQNLMDQSSPLDANASNHSGFYEPQETKKPKKTRFKLIREPQLEPVPNV